MLDVPKELKQKKKGRKGGEVKPFREISREGKLTVNFHSGQVKAWQSKARIVLVLSGCVAGETLIDNPYGRAERIDELAESGKPLTVLAFNGKSLVPAKATSPFCKGIAKLFRVTTTGGRDIVTTLEHKLLVRQNDHQAIWLSVGEISQLMKERDSGIHVCCANPLSSVVFPQKSNLDNAQPIPVLSAHHLSGKEQDCRGNYFGDSYLCDGQSQLGEGNAREVFPYPDLKLDQSCKCLNCDESSLLSEQSQQQQSYVFSSLAPPVSPLYDKWDKVVKIEYVRTSEYYDLSVPFYENYLAQGLIHHNSQGGKTVMGPHWLEREIRERGPGDYLIGTSSFPLLDRKLLPEFLYVFCDLFRYGHYDQTRKVFTFWTKKTVKEKGESVLFPESEEETRVMIGSAQNPESMESATVKGVWLDEVGMLMFRRETWEAVQRRTLINKARMLLTTTPYGWNWLKTELYDRGIKGDSEIEVIQFDSITNPSFPADEYWRMKRLMPAWKFDMFHRGMFSKPAGLIYDAFDSGQDVIEPFEIPEHWPRYVGHDFGPVHTVALWKGYDLGTGIFYTYRDYSMGALSTFEHVRNWLELSKGERIATRYGGSPTENGWRGDFTQAGWRIDKPLDGNVESGIMRVYGYEKLHKHKVFRTCQNYLSEKLSYARELDDNYIPKQTIQSKSNYHFMDAERGMMTQFRQLSAVSGGEPDRAPVATLRG